MNAMQLLRQGKIIKVNKFNKKEINIAPLEFNTPGGKSFLLEEGERAKVVLADGTPCILTGTNSGGTFDDLSQIKPTIYLEAYVNRLTQEEDLKVMQLSDGTWVIAVEEKKS